MRGRYGADAILAALSALLLWSSAFAGISKVVTEGGYGAGETALMRFLVASAAMAVIAAIRRQRLPRRADLPRLALAAVTGITIYHLAFTFGETRVSAAAASLIISSGPIWTALLAVAFLGERFNAWGWMGVGLAFAGVAGIAFGEGGGLEVEPMALLVLAAAVSTAVYFVVSKKPLARYSSLEFTAAVIWLGTLPMLVFAPGLVRQLQTAPVWSTWTVVYLGIFPGALAYAAWSYALARMPASTTASFLYAQPVLATIIAWVWQGVVPGWVTLAGGALALGGVVVVQTKGRPVPVIEVVPATSGDQRAAVREMIDELIGHFGTLWDLDEKHLALYEEERARFDELYASGNGAALLATVDGSLAGCVLLRDDGDGHVEFRRMWVRPPFRRRGVARALLQAAEDQARAMGFRRVRFVTASELEGAADLYRSAGYEQTEHYRDVWSSCAIAFGKDL